MGKWKEQQLKIGIALLIIITMISWTGITPSYAADSSDVPGVVERTTASVVAIIGKPSGTDKASTNRFNLAHGTGVIVKSDGFIITNAHVVKDMNNIVVVTSDGKSYTGKITNMDEESDLALVKIEATGLTAAKLASSSDIRVGETVAAIGTPISFSLRNSVTLGIVSGLERSISSEYQLIQTDAAINPGNSGGALVNMKGEVIGINTLKYAEYGVENLGFAITIDTVKYVLDHFQKYGKVKRSYVGIELEESWEAVVGLPSKDELRVAYVDPDSPAALAGVKQDDLLVSVGGTTVKTMVDYNQALKKYLPGEKVSLSLKSGGLAITKEITLGEVQVSDSKWTDTTDVTGIDTDRGKTRIGDSHYGWSMKYPAGLIKADQSEDGDRVTFVDAKGEFYLQVETSNSLNGPLSPSGLLNKISEGSDSDNILERRYIKGEGTANSYAKMVAKSVDKDYGQIRAYQRDGKIYIVTLFISNVEAEKKKSRLNSLADLLDSFELNFDANNEALKDISVYSDKSTTYTNNYGLSVDLPKAWKKSDYSSSSSFFNEDYSQGIAVYVTSASSGDTLKAWVDRELKAFTDAFATKYRKNEKPKEVELTDVTALQASYSYKMAGEWTNQYSIYLIKDKFKYQIDYTYPVEADKDEVNAVIETLTASLHIDKEAMNPDVGFIQDIDELLDPNATVKYSNAKYKYALDIPEIWSNDMYEDYKDSPDVSFYFSGGFMEISANASETFAETVKSEDKYHKKSSEDDSDYKYKATDITLFKGNAKKYVATIGGEKAPALETTYVFSKNNITYRVTLSIEEAVRTPANEARLNKAFESLTFSAK
ncbi:S1C family serine protease [Paenibacillus eucommiae]|uniref:S1-C subfamily serine protease n=1 Tax=Paenibacillus eucommiae TaxID=1355755 RepID=A0ABS4ISJ8_9BACL|nr:trypsin-like peptidase domain-containing protein [Paenibacillus eucommiae]MBP1990552.1 S1-C subfamily serine protease [Paenibacillus eucommiae]